MYGVSMKHTHRLHRIDSATAAGTSDTITSDALDMGADGGYRNVTFLVLFGAIVSGAVTTIKIQQSSDDGVADGYSDLEGTALSVADTDDGKVIPIHVIRPTKRYLKVLVTRATQNSTIDGMLAIQYDGNETPPTNESVTVATGESHISPPEGTA